MATLSKPKRWADAIQRANKTLMEMGDLVSTLTDALDDLRGVKEEYEEWAGNMPDSLQSSPTGELLAEIGNLEDIEVDAIQEALNDLESALDEYSNMELPRGFGKD